MNKFATQINDTTIRIPADMLRHGMFVCRLDRPWLGTPFLMQGFLVQSDDELRTLKHLCNTLYIDTQKSIVSLRPNHKQALKRSHSGNGIDLPPSIDRTLAKTGLVNALPAYSATIKALRGCHQSYKDHDYLEPSVLERSIGRCLEAVIQNTSAMAWLSRVKSHNQYLSEHSMHVSLLAMVYAVHCGWSKEEARDAGIAGLLFDIGNIKVPKQVLTKPGLLSDSELQLVHEHPKWSRYYLEKSGFNKAIVEGAYFHHERPDGNGYPAKKVGSQTPRIARLLHIIDAYDAMTSHRPYAKQKTVFEATRILYRGRGTCFDSEMVDRFIEMVGVFPIGTIIELSTGEIAVIIGQNNNARLLPKVSVVRDKNKNPIPEALVNLRDLVDASGKPLVRIKTMLNDGAYGLFMKDYTRHLLTS